MDNKIKKAKDNERLIGKTIKWKHYDNELIGKAVEVKDHETIIVLTPDSIKHTVDLFDIISTT